MRRFDSSLPPCGPSPSELVAAFTIATSHPGGVSRRKRACPSGVNAQFRELAARSITSRRSSVNVHPVDVLAPEQRRGRDLELPRRTRELELEGAVFRMIEDTLRFDVDAVSVEHCAYILGRHIHAGANGGARRASGASHPVLQAAESGEHEGDEEARLHSLDVESSAHRHPDRGDDPDRRRRGEPGDHSPRLHDGAGAEEANPADDLSRDAPRVADPPSIGDADPYGDVHQQRGADADENIGAQASGFAGQLTLEADDPAEEDSEPELDEEVEAQYAYDFHHLWNVHVRRWRRQNGGLPPAGGSEQIEVAHVISRGVRRAIAIRHAPRLRFECVDCRVIGLGRGCERPEYGAPALIAGCRRRHCLSEILFLAAGEANQRHYALWSFGPHVPLAV